MPFPRIDHCLICEDVREERGRKATILGFYGVAPQVEILVREFDRPVRQLCFLLVGGPGGGSFKASVRLLDASGADVAPPAGHLTLELAEQPKRSNVVFGIGNIVFPVPGKYRFVLSVEGHAVYEASFDVALANPQDVA